MTIKEATLKSLEEIKGLANYKQIFNYIIENGYYDFEDARTPEKLCFVCMCVVS